MKSVFKAFADPLGIPFIYKARKPLGKALKSITNVMFAKREK